MPQVDLLSPNPQYPAIWNEREMSYPPETGSSPGNLHRWDPYISLSFYVGPAPSVLSSAPPNRSFWNTAAITRSVVKERKAAFLERDITLYTGHQALSTPLVDVAHPHTQALNQSCGFFVDPQVGLFFCILNLSHCCFRINSSWEINSHIPLNPAMQGAVLNEKMPQEKVRVSSLRLKCIIP